MAANTLPGTDKEQRAEVLREQLERDLRELHWAITKQADDNVARDVIGRFIQKHPGSELEILVYVAEHAVSRELRRQMLFTLVVTAVDNMEAVAGGLVRLMCHSEEMRQDLIVAFYRAVRWFKYGASGLMATPIPVAEALRSVRVCIAPARLPESIQTALAHTVTCTAESSVATTLDLTTHMSLEMTLEMRVATTIQSTVESTFHNTVTTTVGEMVNDSVVGMVADTAEDNAEGTVAVPETSMPRPKSSRRSRRGRKVAITL